MRKWQFTFSSQPSATCCQLLPKSPTSGITSSTTSPPTPISLTPRSLVNQPIWNQKSNSPPGAKHGLWLQVPGHGLIHGSCSVEGCVTTALYFPHIKTGVAAIRRGGSNIMHVRFSPPDLTRIPASSGIQ